MYIYVCVSYIYIHIYSNYPLNIFREAQVFGIVCCQSLAMSCHVLPWLRSCKDWWTLSARHYASNDMWWWYVSVFQGFPRLMSDKTTKHGVKTCHDAPSRSSQPVHKIIQDHPGSCWELHFCFHLQPHWQHLATASAYLCECSHCGPCSRVGVNSRWFARLRAVKTFLENLAAEYYWGLFNRFRFLVVIWVIVVWSGHALLCFTDFTGTEDAVMRCWTLCKTWWWSMSKRGTVVTGR